MEKERSRGKRGRMRGERQRERERERIVCDSVRLMLTYPDAPAFFSTQDPLLLQHNH